MLKNVPAFFAYVRRAPFGGRLSQEQVDGLNQILADCASLGVKDPRHAAYALATAFHETGGQMAAIREGFAKSDAQARKILSNRVYAKADPETGHAYYGRGLVQLTWKRNYAVMGKRLDLDLVRHPDLALKLDTASKILVIGMQQGLFTGKKLSDYFNETTDDPEGARKIINGTDKKALIAGYHDNFLAAIEHAQKAVEPTAPAATPAAPAKPAAKWEKPATVDVPAQAHVGDGPPLMKDKTIAGALTAGLGGLSASLLGAIQNPWSLAAFVVVALGVFLVVTGRVEIKHKGGV